MEKLLIDITYMNGVGEFIERDIRNYCKRNKISYATERKRRWGEEESGYLAIFFRSRYQMLCFARQMNKNYPYFEFI